jgi:hypothetical protein
MGFEKRLPGAFILGIVVVPVDNQLSLQVPLWYTRHLEVIHQRIVHLAAFLSSLMYFHMESYTLLRGV